MQTKEIASLLNCDNRRLCERLKYGRRDVSRTDAVCDT